jgi:SAM-dependent methyltransferase
VSPRAFAHARAKAAERGVTARFEVADALNLGQLCVSFDTVIDSGLFHVFDDQARPATLDGEG